MSEEHSEINDPRPRNRGEDVRVKLLEAFSMACPVITTSLGGLGFPLQNGVNALIADSAEAFREGLQRLTASEQLRRDLGESARRMIEQHFAWPRIGTQLRELIEIPRPSRSE